MINNKVGRLPENSRNSFVDLQHQAETDQSIKGFLNAEMSYYN